MSELKKILSKNENNMSDLTLLYLIQGFIEVCERIKNIDDSLLNASIEEINYQLNIIENQDKHPFPILINILSLTGISFILAELFSLF